MKKRNKIILSTMSGLMATTSVVIPLSSCAKQQEKNLYEVIDKEYGVTEATYEKLKGSFSNEIDAYIAKEGMTPEQEAAFREEYNKTINRFDKLSTTNKYGWTSLTSAMVDYARNTYQFKLARESSVKWSELASIYNGMAKSMKTYMESSKLSPSLINKILTEARARFDTIEKSLKEKYGNDALGGMIEAKKQIITCFEDVNDEIALVSATQRLADFADEYQFEYDNEHQENNRLDDLLKDSKLKEGEPITDDVMNDLFKITKKSQPDVDFTFNSSTMIPMFTVTPTLKEIRDDKASNIHILSIDFSLIKSYYKTKYTPEKQKEVTAHLFKGDIAKIGSQIKNNTKTLNQIIQDLPVQTLEFPVEISSRQEQQNIKDIYFDSNKEHITFSWTNDIDKQAYEAFFDGTKRDEDGSKHWTGEINLRSLSAAGLLIGYEKNDPHYAPLADYAKSANAKNELRNQGQENVTLNLAESFLANCTIVSDVDIKETTDGSGQNHNTVLNRFRIRYNNSIYNEESEYAVDAPKCEDCAISKSYYMLTNNKFNQAYKFVTDYTERKFNTFENQADLLALGQGLTITASLIGIGFLIYQVYKGWDNTTDIWNKMVDLLLILISSVILGVQCQQANLIKKNYIDRVKKFTDNVNHFMDDLTDPDSDYKDAHDMFEKINADKEKYFVIVDENGKYNENEYNKKSVAFRNLGSDAFELNEYYSTIMDSDGMKQFIEVQDKHEATADEMHKLLGDWNTGGKYWLISFFLDMAILGLNLVVYYVKKRQVQKIETEMTEIHSVDDPVEEVQAARQLKNEEVQLETVDSSEEIVKEYSDTLNTAMQEWLKFTCSSYDYDDNNKISLAGLLHDPKDQSGMGLLKMSEDGELKLVEKPRHNYVEKAKQEWKRRFEKIREKVKGKDKKLDETLDKELQQNLDSIEKRGKNWLDFLDSLKWK